MGLRFKRSIKISKGAKINLGKTGVSLSVGTRGAHYTVHSSGKKTTSVGLPGTGLSYVSTSGGGTGRRTSQSVSSAAYAQRQREQETQYAQNAEMIKDYNDLIGQIRSIHKESNDYVDWIFLRDMPESFDPMYRGPFEEQAMENADNAKPALLGRLIPLIDKKKEKKYIELEFTSTKDITVKVGKSDSNGYLKVSVKKKNEFVPEDVVFVSENPEIADISFSKASGITMLYYDITGVDGGETNVYATSKDGSVKSESIHVIVPMPIKVETVQIEEVDKTDLYIGEKIKTKVTVAPSDAEDKTITWTSSDEEVATVDEKGIVTAVGGGEATIKATSSNGVEDSFDISVDGSKTLMNLKVRHSREDDVNIGDEWSYDIEIDGERPSKTIGVAAGDTLTFSAEITESDDSPDIGTGSTSYTVTEEDIKNGFEVALDVYVTENGGRNSGQSAHFVVTFIFSPVE